MVAARGAGAARGRAGRAARGPLAVPLPPGRARRPAGRPGLAVLGVEVALEGVEAVRPQAAVRREPRVDLRERLRAQLVPAPLRVLANADEAAVAQDPEVLRHPRLAEPELVHELADGSRALEQQVEDAPARGLREHVEGGRHGRRRTSPRIYVSSDVGLCAPVAVKERGPPADLCDMRKSRLLA